MATRTPIRMLQTRARQTHLTRATWHQHASRLVPRPVPAAAHLRPATAHYRRTFSSTRAQLSSASSPHWVRVKQIGNELDWDDLNWIVLVAVGGYLIVEAFLPDRMRPHDLVSESMEIVSLHSAVTARIGSPLVYQDYEEASWFSPRTPKMEHLTLDDGSDHLRLRVKFHVQGPDGDAVVFAAVNKCTKTGEFDHLMVQFDDGGEILTIADNRMELAITTLLPEECTVLAPQYTW